MDTNPLSLIKMTHSVLKGIYAHAKEAYPQECCGILIGHNAEEGKTVTQFQRAKNMTTDSPHNRYLIEPEETYGATKEAQNQGLEIVGFYHSHPDLEPKPSEVDKEQAWALYSYLIVSVGRGEELRAKSWLFHDEENGGEKAFEEEYLCLVEM